MPDLENAANVNQRCSIPFHHTEIASDGLKGRVFEVSLADLQNDEVAFRKFKLITEDVQGKNCLTNFHGMDLTRDKMCSMVKKWQVRKERGFRAGVPSGREGGREVLVPKAVSGGGAGRALCPVGGKCWCFLLQTMIEAHVDVKTTDGYLLRLFCVGFTKKRNNQIRKTSYAQHQQVRQIRKKMMEIMTREVQTNDLKEVVNKL